MKTRLIELWHKGINSVRLNLPAYLPALIAIALIILEQWLFFLLIGEFQNPVRIAACALGDAMLIVLPFWLLKPRWQWTLCLPVWALSLLLMCNVWNVRAFGDILSPIALTMTGNVDGDVMASVKALMRPGDFIFPLLAVGYTVGYVLLRRRWRPANVGRRAKLWCAGASIVAFLASQCCLTIALQRCMAKEMEIHYSFLKHTRERLNSQTVMELNDYKMNGLIIHSWRSLRQGYAYMNIRRDLTPSEQIEISKFLASDFSFPADTVFDSNREKNLVLVLVESLNSYAIGRQINGRSVTPVLDSIMASGGTITALDVVTQVADGVSSDGQLILNTGLLPLLHGSAGLTVGSSNRFLTLTDLLDKQSNVAVFANSRGLWNMGGVYSNWEFDVFDITDFPTGALSSRGHDGAMFDYADGLIGDLPTPMFVELATQSTHTPWTLDGLETPDWIAQDHGLNCVERNYYTTINYFDCELGRFIDRLKARGMWENTVLVVTGDHGWPAARGDDWTGKPLCTERTAFIAANTGVTLTVGRTVGQVDIFPTILAITGSYDPSKYHGLGIPIMIPELNSAYVPGQSPFGDPDSPFLERQMLAHDISDLILRGNYFSHTER